MAIDGNLPLFLENVGKVWHARQYRRLLEAIFAGPGVLGPLDLKVTPSSPGAMSVDMAAGSGLVKTTTGTDQGLYLVRNSAPILDILIDPSDPTDDRFDIIGLLVLDSEHDGGVLNSGPDNPPYAIIPGTPAGSPVDPALPDNFEPLARIHVDAGATTITTVNNLRRRAPQESFQSDSLAWSAHTADFDVDTITVPSAALHYDVIARPEVSLCFQGSDAVGWDVTFSVFTGPGATGTLLGKSGRRNPGNGVPAQITIQCDEVPDVIAAGDQITLYIHAAYGVATPTTGFAPAVTGDRSARTRLYPSRNY